MTNVRVIKGAWGAFVIWCLIAVGQVYEIRLANAAAQISTLAARVGVLAGERDDLQKKLAENPSQPATPPQRDPGALYQCGELVARAPSGILDRPNGSVSFQSVVGGPNFDVHAAMDYRQFTLSDCQFNMSSVQGSMGVTTAVEYGNVTCRISGLHS